MNFENELRKGNDRLIKLVKKLTGEKERLQYQLNSAIRKNRQLQQEMRKLENRVLFALRGIEEAIDDELSPECQKCHDEVNLTSDQYLDCDECNCSELKDIRITNVSMVEEPLDPDCVIITPAIEKKLKEGDTDVEDK